MLKPITLAISPKFRAGASMTFQDFFAAQDLEDAVDIQVATNVPGSSGRYTVWVEGCCLGRDYAAHLTGDDPAELIGQCLQALAESIDDYEPEPRPDQREFF